MRRRMLPLCVIGLNLGLNLGLSVAGTAACTKLRQTEDKDRRSRDTADDAPATPTTDPAPTPGSPEPGAPADDGDKPLAAPSGLFALSEVHCTVGQPEAVIGQLRFVNQAAGAYVEHTDPAGCRAHQPLTVAMGLTGLEFVPEAVTCDGTCTGACAEQVFGAKGQRQVAPYTPVSGGFVLSVPNVIFPGQCAGAAPKMLAFTRINDDACTQLWTGADAVRATSGVDLAVRDGQLQWSTPTLAAAGKQVLQAEGLTGDFTITLALAGFEAGGPGAAFRLRLEDQANGNYQAFAAFDTAKTAGAAAQMTAAVASGTAFDEAQHATTGARPAASGTLILTKQGTTLTASAQAGDKLVEHRSATAFSNGTYRVVLELSNQHATTALAAPSAASVESVVIRDGAGKTVRPTDDFDCDSL